MLKTGCPRSECQICWVRDLLQVIGFLVSLHGRSEKELFSKDKNAPHEAFVLITSSPTPKDPNLHSSTAETWGIGIPKQSNPCDFIIIGYYTTCL